MERKSMLLPLLGMGMAALGAAAVVAVKAKRGKSKAGKRIEESEKEAKSLIERGDELIEGGERFFEKGIKKLARRS